MPSYTPPLQDMAFLLNSVTPLAALGRDDLDAEMISAVLEEAAKLASGVLAPLNESGDRQGSIWQEGAVTTAKGFKEGYKAFCEGGWNAVPFDPDYGGQGLPWLMSFPLQEMWQSSSLSFGLCPLLTQGAVEAISAHGSDELKQKYLGRLISGEWTGTMNLTEAHAGSDLSLLRTKAERAGDGTYRVSGAKIFITHGEHDMAANIIHLVLARLPDAPEGVKGISLFIVPKILEDGTRNDVTCVSIEHKLGINASPTCTMQFGEKGGAVGYLVGKENDGLKYMFTMMNNARLSVGLQGVAVAERAFQTALAYATDRLQGKPLSGGETVAIIEHPDIRRMLLTMKVLIDAGRALSYEAAFYLDKAKAGDPAAQARVDLLTPIVKAGCTDMAVEVASLGIQVHGGMGFIEETGAAQFYRDARILPIYEGTNGIQAADLLFRKTIRDQGRAAANWIEEAEKMAVHSGDDSLKTALGHLSAATSYLLQESKSLDKVAAVAVPYLSLFFVVAGGVMLTRMTIAAEQSGQQDLAKTRMALSAFYNAHILSKAGGLETTVRQGSEFVGPASSSLRPVFSQR
jgi:alkylation response protein AidB-like acyl-CoA dehydrogenase